MQYASEQGCLSLFATILQPSTTGCGFILSSSVSSYRALELYCEEKAPSKVMQLSLWVAFGCLIGAIAIEEDVGTTRLLEEKATTTTTTTTTSPTTVTEPFTSTPSTTITTTTTSTTIPSSTTTSSTSAVPILARANPISSSSTVRSILSTASGTSGTTAKPSAKRQISLSEFQQLVAKVNDEISMLRNQSANLSQTYEELVRRYNERTSQIPIVLYDVTECSNSSTGPAERLSDTTEKSTELSTIVTATVSNGTETTTRATTTTTERTTTTTTLETTTTTSTTAVPPSSTRKVDYSPPKLVQSELYRDQASLPDAVPPNTGSSHTQIYGNKYYNYIHYFMYPPNESQLEEIHNPFPIGHRRKDGNDARRAPPPRRRRPYEKTKHRWEESIESQEEEEESEFDAQQSSAALRRKPSKTRTPTGELRSNVKLGSTDRRAPLRSPAGPVETYSFDSKPNGELRSNLRFGSTDLRAPVRSPAGLAEAFAYESKPTGELRTNLRLGSTAPRVPFGGPTGPAQPYPYDDSYRAGPVPQRQPIEPMDFLAPAKLPQYPSFPERIPTRISPPQEQFPALKLQTSPPESAPIAPPKKDALTVFLERRKLNRNGPYTVAVPAKLTTPPTTTVARAEAVTPPSVESLFTFGAKPVSYAIPTTVKPSLGVVRNGWDANDFSFIRKAQESKKRLQRERRSWGARLSDL
uniref:Uncharacterized protein n=1 Tax=Anopheles gambiae TaxID=7165 RepID=A0A1S4GSC3_ANOGA